MKFDKFFNQEVPGYLKKLKAETRPKWGTMGPAEMINHLRQGLALSMDDSKRNITTPKDKLPGMKAFLMGDKPFPPNRNKPDEYNKYQFSETEFIDKKVELLRAVIALQVHFKKNPEFTSIHPSFGVLNKDEWLQLHYKHIRHHFSQFNLIEE